MKKNKIFSGIAFILIGIFLIISKLGYFSDISIFSLILTAILVVIIVKSLIHLNFGGILFPIAFICIIYDKQLGITNITPWTVLIAALLGTIGFSMIFNKNNKHIHFNYNSDKGNFKKIDEEDDDYIKFRNSYNSSIKYVNTDNFEKADFECKFGAMKVYFDNAVMKNESAVVRIDASFSGVELYVPKAWKVDDQTNAFLGSVTEKNNDNTVITNTLILVGDVSFGSIEIIYV